MGHHNVASTVPKSYNVKEQSRYVGTTFVVAGLSNELKVSQVNKSQRSALWFTQPEIVILLHQCAADTCTFWIEIWCKDQPHHSELPHLVTKKTSSLLDLLYFASSRNKTIHHKRVVKYTL